MWILIYDLHTLTCYLKLYVLFYSFASILPFLLFTDVFFFSLFWSSLCVCLFQKGWSSLWYLCAFVYLSAWVMNMKRRNISIFNSFTVHMKSCLSWIKICWLHAHMYLLVLYLALFPFNCSLSCKCLSEFKYSWLPVFGQRCFSYFLKVALNKDGNRDVWNVHFRRIESIPKLSGTMLADMSALTKLNVL